MRSQPPTTRTNRPQGPQHVRIRSQRRLVEASLLAIPTRRALWDESTRSEYQQAA